MAKKQSPISKYLAKIGSKGGEKKVPKGLAMVSPERAKEIRAKALATRQANAAKKAKAGKAAK